MRYTRVELEGPTGLFATLSRRRGAGAIEVEVLSPDRAERRRVGAGDAAGLRSEAERLHAALEGRPGSAAELEPYLGALGLLGGG